MKTTLGSALDPMADKILMTVLTVSLAGVELIPGEFCRGGLGKYNDYPGQGFVLGAD